MDTTILVQGEANSISLDHIDTYRKYGRVIISCYFNDKVINEYVFAPDVMIVRSDRVLPPAFNGGNVFMQCWTTLAGLNLCITPYVIKVRSDEKYNNLQPVIDKLHNNKIITNNIHFNKTHIQPLHPSDHLIAGRTTLIRRIYNTVLEFCTYQYGTKFDMFDTSLLNMQLGHVTVETLIAIASLITQGANLFSIRNSDIQSIRELIKKYFDVVTVKELEGIWTCKVNGYPRLYRKGDECLKDGMCVCPSSKCLIYGWSHEHPVIHNMEQI